MATTYHLTLYWPKTLTCDAEWLPCEVAMDDRRVVFDRAAEHLDDWHYTARDVRIEAVERDETGRALSIRDVTAEFREEYAPEPEPEPGESNHKFQHREAWAAGHFS